MFIISYDVWKITATFVTTGGFTHEGSSADTVSVIAVNEKRIDCEFRTVGGRCALERRRAGVGFADGGDAIVGDGDDVGGFAAAFVVGGGIAHEGGETGAIAFFAGDPVNVEGEVSAVFFLGAFRSTADREALLEDDSVRGFTAASVIGGCRAREGVTTHAGAVHALNEAIVHGEVGTV